MFTNWQLSRRLLVNPEECQVWHWLCKTFPQHHVNIKIPVTRFTRPLEPEQGKSLYKLLDGVYCTFTVCSPNGRVLGCADVMGANGLSSNNRQLKQNLLDKCGIVYYVLRPVSLPATATIRNDFLGETAAAESAMHNKPRAQRYQELEEALLAEARRKLSTTLGRQRYGRESRFSPLVPNSFPDALAHASSHGFEKGNVNDHALLPGSQYNSFLMPLESRHRE